MKKLLIANRGEIAVRILRAANDMGIATVAVFSNDDAAALHVRLADESRVLSGAGAAAYLDGDALVGVARETGCDALHPGYGFVSENATFARACESAGLTFVGPAPETLDTFGDKGRARALARERGIPIPAGTFGATTLDEAEAFLRDLGPGGAVMLKAVVGGGGRGMRLVRDPNELATAFERASSEASSAFGNGELYVERVVADARHVEVQIAGDGTGAVTHLFERECSVQRGHQKLVEIAPAPHLIADVCDRLYAAALTLARAVAYRNLGTFEFLLDHDGSFVFIEANARLQVEHTVTEEITGIDLVRLQLALAGGASLAELDVERRRGIPRGHSLQARVNMETMDRAGNARSTGGTLTAFEIPSGPGVRVDTFGYVGYATNPLFDSLLAKVIVTTESPAVEDVVAKASRALREFRIDGVETNRNFLLALLARPEVRAGRATTTFVHDHIAELVVDDPASAHFEDADGASPTFAVRAPLSGRVVGVEVEPGARVRTGTQIAVIDAMKMEHVIVAMEPGIVAQVNVVAGEIVFADRVLAVVQRVAGDAADDVPADVHDPTAIRPDLAETIARHRILADAARPAAVARRRKTGQRTTRENIAQLCDDGTFVEYGGLALPAQRRRRTLDDLIETGQADGLVAGTGDINGTHVTTDRARCMVLAYDYTVMAGTQGAANHRKMDRLFTLAERYRMPIVLFAEGGGGRPGDIDHLGVAHLDVMTFAAYGHLSGLVPRIGIVSGRCFAGNAALLGASDVIIATANATIGMGGPAMIEGGGLGVFTPEEVGPMAMQVPNGVVDIAVADEIEAVDVAKRYLSYFQGPIASWSCADQTALRNVVPENRLRVYDVRHVVEMLADDDSVLEIRTGFGRSVITAFARVEGRPFGILASNPAHLGGAIDADAADKGARFMQLCDAFSIPLLFLCDTPGIMVGPDAERTGLVRHAARLFVTAATLTIPFFTIVLRKGYGLGAQAMAGGSFHAGFFTVSWPTGEFGAMGIEGAIRLGYRKELDAVTDPLERKALFDRMVADAYREGKALNTASYLEIDDVIDPAESRRWIRSGLDLTDLYYAKPDEKRRTVVDAW